MAREIVLDTETTGFDPRTGDRMIEVFRATGSVHTWVVTGHDALDA